MPIMHIDGFARGKGKFVITEYIPTDERTGPRFPLLLTTGRILSQYNVGAQTRRTENSEWHEEDVLEIHPHDAEDRGIRTAIGCACRAAPARRRCAPKSPTGWQPGVVYTTFHHPMTQANVITTDNSDWATNCPEYKVTAVQISPSNGPTDWQEQYRELSEASRRIASTGSTRRNEREELIMAEMGEARGYGLSARSSAAFVRETASNNREVMAARRVACLSRRGGERASCPVHGAVGGVRRLSVRPIIVGSRDFRMAVAPCYCLLFAKR